MNSYLLESMACSLNPSQADDDGHGTHVKNAPGTTRQIADTFKIAGIVKYNAIHCTIVNVKIARHGLSTLFAVAAGS